MNRIVALLNLIAILSLQLSGCVCVCVGEMQEAELPKYSVGDWWIFNVDYVSDIGMIGTMKIEVVDTSCPISQSGHTYDCCKLNWTGTGSIYGQISGEGLTGSWTMKGEYHLLASDLSDVKSELTTDGSLTYIDKSMTLKEVQTVTYNPPLESSKGFPLTAGESWSAATTKTERIIFNMNGYDKDVTNTTTSTKNYFVIRSERKTVTAGEFDTFVIKTIEADGNYFEEWFSPEVGREVLAKAYNSTGHLQTSFELLGYNYAAANVEFPWMMIASGAVVGIAVIVGVGLYIISRRKRPVPTLSQAQDAPSETSMHK